MKRREFIAGLAATTAAGTTASAETEQSPPPSTAARPLAVTLLGTGTPARRGT